MYWSNQPRASTPLPEGWESKYDPSSRKWYYINHTTKKTQWDDPRLSQQQTSSATKQAPNNVTIADSDKIAHIMSVFDVNRIIVSSLLIANKNQVENVKATLLGMGYRKKVTLNSNHAVCNTAAVNSQNSKIEQRTEHGVRNVNETSRPNTKSLPTGWESKYDSTTGKWYYVNHITKVTQWNDPRQSTQAVVPKQDIVVTPKKDYPSVPETVTQTTREKAVSSNNFVESAKDSRNSLGHKEENNMKKIDVPVNIAPSDVKAFNLEARQTSLGDSKPVSHLDKQDNSHNSRRNSKQQANQLSTSVSTSISANTTATKFEFHQNNNHGHQAAAQTSSHETKPKTLEDKKDEMKEAALKFNLMAGTFSPHELLGAATSKQTASTDFEEKVQGNEHRDTTYENVESDMCADDSMRHKDSIALCDKSPEASATNGLDLQNEDKPCEKQCWSSLRVKPKGPNPLLHKGPNPLLLLESHMQPLGPDKTLRKGPQAGNRIGSQYADCTHARTLTMS
ncbi:uncharacterized protein LOC143468892 isoform X1 [Clavelina lepadiformis]|uniref:uncharacterized protein LOC143468892 isoform X1 n=1 Tax=Clavelina lepadiformis TaxID=159417 RepID=UPI004042DC4E